MWGNQNSWKTERTMVDKGVLSHSRDNTAS